MNCRAFLANPPLKELELTEHATPNVRSGSDTGLITLGDSRARSYVTCGFLMEYFSCRAAISTRDQGGFDDQRPQRYPVPMSALTIGKMTWDEKLRAMEELWKSLSREEVRLESPPWHEEALRETAARHDAGKEQPVDWEAAKRELRKRAE
jgi:Putative addiction module component